MSAATTLPRNTAAIKVGRLLEVRVLVGYRTTLDVDQLFDEIDREVARFPPTQKFLTIADWRHMRVLAPEAAERVGQRIALLNPRTLRSCALVPTEAPVAVLQFVRLVRQSNLADRKAFDDGDELVRWMQEIMTPEETVRLREFVFGPIAGLRR